MDALPLKLKLVGELSAQIYYQFMSINEELGRHRGQSDRQSVLYVVLSVRVRSMCCGNVLITKVGESFKSMGIVRDVLLFFSFSRL